MWDSNALWLLGPIFVSFLGLLFRMSDSGREINLWVGLFFNLSYKMLQKAFMFEEDLRENHRKIKKIYINLHG